MGFDVVEEDVRCQLFEAPSSIDLVGRDNVREESQRLGEDEVTLAVNGDVVDVPFVQELGFAHSRLGVEGGEVEFCLDLGGDAEGIVNVAESLFKHL